MSLDSGAMTTILKTCGQVFDRKLRQEIGNLLRSLKKQLSFYIFLQSLVFLAFSCPFFALQFYQLSIEAPDESNSF